MLFAHMGQEFMHIWEQWQSQICTILYNIALCGNTNSETIRIVIEDYVQHLSGYHLQLKFDPTLIFSSKFQYQNRIALEFNQLYHWHPLMPNSFFIEGTEITYDKFIYNTSILTQYGVEKLVQAFSTQPAGQ
ncbi:prostaglandin G/H synthase 1 isoform X1, partial [Tachysurus ichikawai]